MASVKIKAEMEVWRGMGEGLDAVIINPSTVLGFGNWHDSSCAIFKNSYKGFPWYTKGVNGFVAVEDVAKIAVLLMESNITEERFIINHENWEFKNCSTLLPMALDKNILNGRLRLFKQYCLCEWKK